MGNDDLARDGRQQQAEIEADAEAVPQAERAEPGVDDENPALGSTLSATFIKLSGAAKLLPPRSLGEQCRHRSRPNM